MMGINNLKVVSFAFLYQRRFLL